MKSACIATLALVGIVSSAAASNVPRRMRTQNIRRQLGPGDDRGLDEEEYDPTLGLASSMSMSVATDTDATSDESGESDVTTEEGASSASSFAVSGLVSAVCIAGAYSFM